MPYKYLILALILLYSCTPTHNIIEESEHANINIPINPQNAENMQFSDFFSSVEYIPIPTDSNFLIGNIDKLSINDSLIILMDKSISNSIFIFNTQNKDKLRLHKSGKGPGEYNILTDIYYDKNKKAIGIHCKRRRKLIYYTIQGKYIQEKFIPFYASRVLPLRDSYALFCDYSCNPESVKQQNFANLILSNSQNKILSTANYFNGDIKRSLVYTSDPDFSIWNNDTLSIKPDHSNIIFHLTSDRIYPAYKLDFGEYTLDHRFWDAVYKENITFEKITELCNNWGICESFNVLENKNHIFFRYKFKGKVNSVFYSKKNNMIFNIKKFENDMDGITVFYPRSITDKKIYCVLTVEDLLIAKNYLIQKKLISEKILNNVREFDNPIIVAFTLKDF